MSQVDFPTFLNRLLKTGIADRVHRWRMFSLGKHRLLVYMKVPKGAPPPVSKTPPLRPVVAPRYHHKRGE